MPTCLGKLKKSGEPSSKKRKDHIAVMNQARKLKVLQPAGAAAAAAEAATLATFHSSNTICGEGLCGDCSSTNWVSQRVLARVAMDQPSAAATVDVGRQRVKLLEWRRYAVRSLLI